MKWALKDSVVCNPCHKLYGLDNKECIIVHFSELIGNIYYEDCLFFFLDRLRKDQDNITNIKDTLEKVLIELGKGIREMGVIIDIGIKRR